MYVLEILKILLGLVFLYAGSEALLSGGVGLSVRLGIPRVVIGLVFIALGTSLPELFVSAVAIAQGNQEVAVANIFGSNIINLALILGASMLIVRFPMHGNSGRMDVYVLVGTFAVLPLLALRWNDGVVNLVIGRLSGGALLAILVGYYIFLYRYRRHTFQKPDKNEQGSRSRSPYIMVGLLVFGSLALYFGSRWLVDGAVAVAKASGMSDRLIAITIVAHGTNMPEFFATLAAIRRRETDIIIGNVIGSNLINTLFILGLIGVAHPMIIRNASQYGFDLGVMLLVALITGVSITMTTRKYYTRRIIGMILCGIYICYFAVLIALHIQGIHIPV